MWGAPEEPPDDTEVAGPSESMPEPPANLREISEDNKSQVETFKDIMLKNKNELRKKEEELQEYASKLSEIKSRAKLSRRSKDGGPSSVKSTPKPTGDGTRPDADEDTVDDISQAKTPKAKSSLLQRKLAENRKIFEQRSKEMTENKRAVEEKVEAIRQQMDQTDLTIVDTQKDSLTVTPVRPVLITPQIMSPPDLQIGLFQDKDNKIAELNNRILELEATVIDLQDNLKEKDSVIDSKTKAVTLMSADLSKKGKSTLDTLEDTKDEMRTMQENFVLIETSLKGKNENLLEQLQERNDKVAELETAINRYEQEIEEKRLVETASASASRTTMDTLADTKDEMRIMQENFILIETSLKEKIDNLLQQLQQRETKLAEAEEKVYKLESGAGIAAAPEIPDLQYKIERLEQSNRTLQDEKYELQKSIAALQEQIVTRETTNGNGLVVEKDNRIAELENLIEELKSSNQLLEEESKAELQKQVDELATKNEQFRSKIDDLEKLNNDLEIEKNELRAKIPETSDVTKEDALVKNLKKELDDLNKSMIKLKAQHKGKLRNLQKQLESFKMVSDANAELVKLGNQVALLEEEKGNLQLSLVDFDELKASTVDWQDRIADLESRVSTQANDIQAHVDAIAVLENQKLDLMQELHTVKQEISGLEAENADSENLRVTAEMKIVDMEEQIESLHKLLHENSTSESSVDATREELLSRIESLVQENGELRQRVAKLEEKPSSEAGSTESFETIHEDRNELTKRIEALSARNIELEEQLEKLKESSRLNIDSTESFETINDTDKSELMKKIDLLSRENSDLVTRLNKFEEKGSSDTGSTESFEKIPEHVEGSSKIELLTKENNELVIKLTKLEERLENLTMQRAKEKSEALSFAEEVSERDEKMKNLVRENNELVIELTKVQEKLSRISDEKATLLILVEEAKTQNETSENLKKQIESLTAENHDMIIKLVKLEEKNVLLSEHLNKLGETESDCRRNLESGTVKSHELLAEYTERMDEMKQKLADREAELEMRINQIAEYEAANISAEELQRELKESSGAIDEWKYKYAELEQKINTLETGKMSIEESLRVVQDENRVLTEEAEQKDNATRAVKQELDEAILNFANRLDEERTLAVQQEQEMATLQELLRTKDQDIHEKYSLLQNEMIKIDSLQEELNDCRNQLDHNEAVIANLSEEIKKLTEETSSSKEELSMARSEIVVLREELDSKAAKEMRNEELHNEMKNLLNEQLRENADLRTVTENANKAVERLQILLIEKENEVASLVEVKTMLEDQLRDSIIAKAKVDEQLASLEKNLEDSGRYGDDLKAELSEAYEMLELLKAKHKEDIEMQNTRLEDLVEELNGRITECENLREELAESEKRLEDLETKTSAELESLRAELADKARNVEVRTMEFETCREQLTEKEILVGRNVTEPVKIALEQRVIELEEKLIESENNTQMQLQKRKILAANLKKKSAQYDELETRATEFATRVAELEPKAAALEAEASELETKVAELEPKAAAFEAKASELEAKVGELEPKAAAFEAKASELEAKVAELEPKAAAFEAKASELEASVAELEPRAAAFEAKASELEAKVAELEPKAASFEAKASELEAKVAELEPKAAAFEAKASELEAKVAELEPKATAFEAKASEFAAKVAELEPKAAEFEAKAKELEAKVAELEPKAAEFEAKVKELEGAVGELEPKAAEFEARTSELEAKVAEIEPKTAEFEAKASEFAARVAELEPRAAEFEAQASEFAARVAELEPRAAEFEAKALELGLRAAEFEAKAEEFETKATKLGSKADEYETKATKLEATVAEFEAKTADLETKNAYYEAKVAELEPKAVELEEKWIMEKSEKEMSNLRILDLERAIGGKDDAIIQLENQLSNARGESALVIDRAETLSRELHNSTERINILMEQVREMSDVIQQLRGEIAQKASEMMSERMEKENVVVQYEACKSNIIDEETQRQQVLEEAKEKARELGVRMQVMESEYVEHLNTIQTLRTENGMLVSKQAQINERLENVEKEASERKVLLDQLQREKVLRETESLRQSEEAASCEEERTRLDEKVRQSCDQCDQCQTVVQALEAKLQERDAEIENLDNELANSIGNFVHMRESLRVNDLMNQSGSRTRSHEEARDELVAQYNALTASNAEIRDQLNTTIRENEELKEKIVSLQALNVALQERTGAAEEELIEGRDAATRLHEADSMHARLVATNQERERDLQVARSDLEIIKQRYEESMTSMRSQIVQLETYNNELTRNCEELARTRNEAEKVIVELRDEVDRCQRKTLELEIEIEKYRDANSKIVEVGSPITEPRAASSLFPDATDDGPQLFDAAKVFGLPAVSDSNGQKEFADLRNAVANRNAENAQLRQEIKRLSEHIANLESHVHVINAQSAEELQKSHANYQRLEMELAQIQELLGARNNQIESLNSELHNVGVQLSEQFNRQGSYDAMESTIKRLTSENEENISRLRDGEATVENLSVGNNKLAEELETLRGENLHWVQTMDLVLSILGNPVMGIKTEDLSILEARSPVMHARLVEITNSLEASIKERQELLAHLETCKQRIATLEKELETSSDLPRIQELEERVNRVIRERDIKQLQVNDLARSLEEMQESMETASSNEEVRLRNLQASLDRALSDNDQLKMRLETMGGDYEASQRAHDEKLLACETAGQAQSEKLRVCETAEQAQSEKLKECEATASQVAQSSEIRSQTDVESGWDDEAKLDEAIWSWNPEDADLTDTQNLMTASTLLPSLERRLNAKIAELEDTIRDLEGDRDKLTEDMKSSQIRSGKLVKKLKEFKIQNEILHQQLKMQKATGAFCDLDNAIEEELKSQIVQLEKALNESKDEMKKVIVERDSLTKRIDVLSAANERLVEMKERQDMEVEVLHIRLKELSNKLQSMEWQVRDTCGEETPSFQESTNVKQTESLQGELAAPAKFECLCKKYQEEIDDLRDEMEALASENEQLQKILEEQKATRSATESRLGEELTVRGKEIETLSQRNSELEKALEGTRMNYQSLMDQCDQSIKTSEEQIASQQKSYDILKNELVEKTTNFEAEMNNMRHELNSASAQIDELRANLRSITAEKDELIERTKSHEETKEKLASLGDSMTELTDLLSSRVQEVAELKREIQKLKSDRNEALDTVEGLAQNHSRELSIKTEETQLCVRNCELRLNEQSEEISTLNEKLTASESMRETILVNVENLREEITRLNNALTESRSHRESLQSELANKEQELFRDEDEVRKYALEIERLNGAVEHLQKLSVDTMEEANRRIREIEEREANLKRTIAELTTRESDALAQMYREISEKDSQVTSLQQTVANLEAKMHDIVKSHAKEKPVEPVEMEISPSSKMTSDEIQALQTMVEQLREELSRKNEEIEDYKYQLSASTYPSIIQALQDQLNTVYEDKAKIEGSLEIALQELSNERELRQQLTENTRYQSRQLKSMRIEETKEDGESRNEDELTNVRDDKDNELRNLRREIDERVKRFANLHDSYESVEVEVSELRMHLGTKEEEIEMLQRRLESMGKECELLRLALKRELPRNEIEELQRSETSSSSTSDTTKEQSSNELDIALYMLHQRDVKCDELTLELMQLLEERDTLQLRLSNAIRVNEDLRKTLPIEAQSSESLQAFADTEPIVEKPSPSRSVGPVEIAKEAIDSPSEEKAALAQKLSQLHNMGHRRDVRLMDERELRHNQQMSLLAHRDVLNTLPPEAAARLVNANYTVSRDVQSQSSILMNWLWGKSTPKVVHM